MALKIAQSAKPEDDDYWQWSAWLEGSSGELDDVKQVVWRLHPTFVEPIRRVTSRSTKFRLDTSGWGEFEIHADVHLKSGKLRQLRHWLRLEEAAEPSADALKQTAKVSKAGERRPQALYLSYTRRNAELAWRLGNALRSNGYVAVLDLDIPAGEDFRRWSTEKILESDAVVVLVGEDRSSWHDIEINTALSGGARLIPVTLGDQSSLPPLLKKEKVKPIRMKNGDPSMVVGDIAHRIIDRLTG